MAANANGLFIIEKVVVRKEKICRIKCDDIDNCLTNINNITASSENDNNISSNNEYTELDGVIARNTDVTKITDVINKLPPTVNKLTLDKQSLPTNEIIDIPYITCFNLIRYPNNKLYLNTYGLKTLVIDRCAKLNDFEFIRDIEYLEHLEIKDNKYLKQLTLPDNVKNVTIMKCPSITAIKPLNTYGLPHIKSLIVDGNLGKSTRSMQALSEIPIDMPNLEHLVLTSSWRMTSDVLVNPPDISGINDPITQDIYCIDLPNSLAKLKDLSLVGFKHVTLPEDLVSTADLTHLHLQHIWATNIAINCEYPRLTNFEIYNSNVNIVKNLRAPNVVSVYINHNFGTTNDWISYWLDNSSIISLHIIDHNVSDSVKINLCNCVRFSMHMPHIKEIDLCNISKVDVIEFTNMSIKIKNWSHVVYNSNLISIFMVDSKLSNHKFAKPITSYGNGIRDLNMPRWLWNNIGYNKIINNTVRQVLRGPTRASLKNTSSTNDEV